MALRGSHSVGNQDAFTGKEITGSRARIHAKGANWVIQNVAFTNSGHPRHNIAAEVTDPDGVGIIDSVYMGDGGDTGVWVSPRHKGTLYIRNCYFANFPDNAVYGSPPGNESNRGSAAGQGGKVIVLNSYFENNGRADVRLGTEGSFAKGCVLKSNQRAFWGYYETTSLIDCDVFGPIVAGSAAHPSKPGNVVAQNCRIASDVNHRTLLDASSIHAPSNGAPRDRIPNGVPTSPNVASATPQTPATPGSGSGGSSGGSGNPQTKTITFSGDGDYDFAVSGKIIPTDTADLHDNTDRLYNSDSAAEGMVGGGGTDAWNYTGDIIRMDADSSVQTSGDTSVNPAANVPEADSNVVGDLMIAGAVGIGLASVYIVARNN